MDFAGIACPIQSPFLSEDWKELGTKQGLRKTISSCTGIPIAILSGAGLETASIAQIMSSASRRKTTRIEDCAYCLMGIFGINMPLLYGEGRRAFIRLQEEILRISDDQSLFAWKSLDSRGGLLARSPYAFIDSNNIVPSNASRNLGHPPSLSSRGIHLELRFIARGSGGLGMVILRCIARDKENKPLAIYVKDTTLAMQRFERVWSENFECVNLSRFPISQYPIRKIYIQTGRMSPASKCDTPGSRNNITKQLYDDETLINLMKYLPPAALFRAAEERRHFDVWVLLTRNDVKASSKGSDGRTVLWHAVMRSHKVLMKMLLARSDVDANSVDINGLTPLLWAAANANDEDIVKMLVDNGADLEAKDGHGQMPLWVATRREKAAIVKLLLEAGANVNAENRTRLPLFSMAVMDGSEAIVELLRENGAAVKSRHFFWSDVAPLPGCERVCGQRLSCCVRPVLILSLKISTVARRLLARKNKHGDVFKLPVGDPKKSHLHIEMKYHGKCLKFIDKRP